MAGAGIIKAEYNESEIQAIIDALGKASAPDLFAIADSAGAELRYISKKAFEKEKDPVTGKKWDPIQPRGSGAKKPGSVTTILRDYGQLKRSLTFEAFPDGSVIFGSNMVYARIHQEGGQAGRGKKTTIPARPYMGVPKDFDRNFLNDPKILDLLGIGG